MKFKFWNRELPSFISVATGYFVFVFIYMFWTCIPGP